MGMPRFGNGQFLQYGILVSPGILIVLMIILRELFTGNSPTKTRALAAKSLVGLLGYLLTCVAIVLVKSNFFANPSVIVISLFLITTACFLAGAYFDRIKSLSYMLGSMFLLSGMLSGFGNWGPQVEISPSLSESYTQEATRQRLVDLGETIIFGGIGRSRVRGAIGKGQCPLCHLFEPGEPSERAPSLWGITSRQRSSSSPLVYLAESHVCPNCYVVGGFDVRGTDGKESPMPVITKPPISLSLDELVQVDTWIYFNDGEALPDPEEIKAAYRSTLSEKEWQALTRPEPSNTLPAIEIGVNDPPDEMFKKAFCTACHEIPGVWGPSATIGPRLAMKTLAPLRRRDPNYHGQAKSDRDYIRESILNPNTYAALPSIHSPMPETYSLLLSWDTVERMVDYLSSIE